MGFSRDTGEVVRYSATPRSYLSAFETMEWLPWVYPEKTADRALYAGGAMLLLAGLAVVIATSGGVRRAACTGSRAQACRDTDLRSRA